MAVVRSGQYGIDMRDFALGTLQDDYPTIKDSDFFRVEWEFASYYDFYGKGFKYDANGMPIAGTITGFGIGNPDGPFFTVKGIAVSPKELMKVGWSETQKDDDRLIHSIFAGSDSIIGGKDRDYENGFGGDDTLRGAGGEDKLIGGGGADHLDGGTWSDTMTGGDGADTFVFSAHYGTDMISDFHANGSEHDVIDLSRLPSIKNFADLVKHHVSSNGDNLAIDAGNDELTLHHVSKHDLSKDDFIFA